MAQVTVEGTATPSTFLKTGHRITVEATPYIQKLVRGGFIRIVAAAGIAMPVPTEQAVGGAVQPTPADPDSVPVVLSEGGPVEPISPAITPPSRAASRDTWANFITGLDIGIPDGASRDDLIRLWDDRA